MAKYHAAGGHARAKALSGKRRQEIALAAAKARWGQPRPPRKRRHAFSVTLTLPTGVTVEEAREYIEDAVCAWCGSLQPPGYGPGGPDPNEPGDPMHSLNTDTIKVRVLR